MKRAIVMLFFLLVACAAPSVTPEAPAVQETVEPVVQETAPIVQESPAEPSNNESPLAPPAVNTEQTLEGVKEFHIEAKQFEFIPAEIKVKKGDKVKIYLTSLDVSHSILIPDFGVSIAADKDAPGEGEFLAHKSGTFSFRCGIPCGADHKSMKGTLIVE